MTTQTGPEHPCHGFRDKFGTQTNLVFSQCIMEQLKDKEIWSMVV